MKKIRDLIPKRSIKIDETSDADYQIVKIEKVGLVPPFGQGALVLKSDEGKEFPMSAFSGEVAQHIANFIGQKRDELPSIYNMVEQICEESEIFLVKVKLYESGGVLRANLYFTGKRDLILRNFRASDAIALATYYSIPILLRRKLLENQNFPNA